MGKQDMALRGGIEGGLQQRPLPAPGPKPQSWLRRKASPCWACSSRLATCAAQEACLCPPGGGEGQSPEGGVDWCLDKVREETELKGEDRLAWGQD